MSDGMCEGGGERGRGGQYEGGSLRRVRVRIMVQLERGLGAFEHSIYFEKGFTGRVIVT